MMVGYLRGDPYQVFTAILREPFGTPEHREFLFGILREMKAPARRKLVEDSRCTTLMGHHASVERNILRWLSNRYKDIQLSEQLIYLLEIFVIRTACESTFTSPIRGKSKSKGFFLHL
jgi:hypothetical protein